MIAPLRQPLSAELATRVHRAGAAGVEGADANARARDGWVALAVGVAAFFCMLPYPAYAVGNATAVQIGNACAAALCVPVLWMSWRGRAFGLYPLLVAPLLIAAFAVSVSGGDQATLAYKSAAVWAMSLMAMLAVQACAPRYALPMLSGIAGATLLHAAVGVWQTIAFTQNHFPLVELYVNPSFLSVQENADTIARWTKRPFGIFPEPSAMSASLSPFVLIWVALLSGVVRLRQPMTVNHRVLFGAAAAGGMGLIILSRSGQTAITMLAVLLITGLWIMRAAATRATFLAVIAASGVILPVVFWLAAQSVADRISRGPSGLGNSSWHERASSIMLAFSMYTGADLKTVLFGFGPGLTSFAVTQRAGLEAVWSVSLVYLFDTGVVGLLAVVALAGLLLGNWRRVRFDLAFAAIILTWLVGVTLTTSYDQLLPPWLALGFFTVWPEVFAPAAAVAREIQGGARRFAWPAPASPAHESLETLNGAR